MNDAVFINEVNYFERKIENSGGIDKYINLIVKKDSSFIKFLDYLKKFKN